MPLRERTVFTHAARALLVASATVTAWGSANTTSGTVPLRGRLTSAWSREASPSEMSASCNYTSHPNVTYLDPNSVILCINGEGVERCRLRCDDDAECAGIGAYYPLSSGSVPYARMHRFQS